MMQLTPYKFLLRGFAVGLALLASLASLALQAQTRLTVPGTTVSFEAPKGFTELSAKELALKYPRGNPPKQVTGDARRTTSIGYDIKNHRIPDAELEKFMAFFSNNFSRLIPGLQWKRKEIVEMEGKRWILLEMTSSAIDTDIHNIMLVTPHEDKLLMFNFNSTREEFPKNEQALRDSIASIRLK